MARAEIKLWFFSSANENKKEADRD